jgi:hypothetical protein
MRVISNIMWSRGGVFEVAKHQSFLQMALPPKNCPTSKGLMIVRPPRSGTEMGKVAAPVQSSVLGRASKFQ